MLSASISNSSLDDTSKEEEDGQDLSLGVPLPVQKAHTHGSHGSCTTQDDVEWYGYLVVEGLVVQKVYGNEEDGVEKPSLERDSSRFEEEVLRPSREVDVGRERKQRGYQELSESDQGSYSACRSAKGRF